MSDIEIDEESLLEFFIDSSHLLYLDIVTKIWFIENLIKEEDTIIIKNKETEYEFPEYLSKETFYLFEKYAYEYLEKIKEIN